MFPSGIHGNNMLISHFGKADRKVKISFSKPDSFRSGIHVKKNPG